MKKRFGNFGKRTRKPMDLKSIILYAVLFLFFFVATVFAVGFNFKTVVFLLFMAGTLVFSIFKFVTMKNSPIAKERRERYEEFINSVEDDFDYEKYENEDFEEMEGESNENY